MICSKRTYEYKIPQAMQRYERISYSHSPEFLGTGMFVRPMQTWTIRNSMCLYFHTSLKTLAFWQLSFQWLSILRQVLEAEEVTPPTKMKVEVLNFRAIRIMYFPPPDPLMHISHLQKSLNTFRSHPVTLDSS